MFSDTMNSNNNAYRGDARARNLYQKLRNLHRIEQSSIPCKFLVVSDLVLFSVHTDGEQVRNYTIFRPYL